MRLLNYFIVSLFLIILLCSSIGAENSSVYKTTPDGKKYMPGNVVVQLTENGIINTPKGIGRLYISYISKDSNIVVEIDSVSDKGKIKSRDELSSKDLEEISITSQELINVMERYSINSIEKSSPFHISDTLDTKIFVEMKSYIAKRARAFVFTFPDTVSVDSVINELEKLSIIEEAKHNTISMQLDYFPTDGKNHIYKKSGKILKEEDKNSTCPEWEYYYEDDKFKNEKQWGLRAAKFDKVWKEFLPENIPDNIQIAILDPTGFDVNHEDFEDNWINRSIENNS